MARQEKVGFKNQKEVAELEKMPQAIHEGGCWWMSKPWIT